jgi:hypothetical protein
MLRVFIAHFVRLGAINHDRPNHIAHKPLAMLGGGKMAPIDFLKG